MKHLIHQHFELLVLVFLFIFSTAMLAAFPQREEMARWIEGGVAIAAIVTITRGRTTNNPPPSKSSTSVTPGTVSVTTETKAESEGESHGSE